MKPPVQVAFASGSEDLVPTMIERMRELAPDLPLYAVSEFPVDGVTWIPFHPRRDFRDNMRLLRATFAGKRIVYCGMILQPRMPYWGMRLMAFLLAPARTIFFNDNLDHFMLRPRSAATIARHLLWRFHNLLRWELRPGGGVYTLLWRLRHPSAFRRPLLHMAALCAGRLAALCKRCLPAREERSAGRRRRRPDGVSVVIPSRDGRQLLERLLPLVLEELDSIPSEVIVVDNGSSDGSADFLAGQFPTVRVEQSAPPLSFARAVNRGIARASFARVVLLNNDMILRRGFFYPLLAAFDRVPDLFCATAQIFFPEGERRQETGKAVMPRPAVDLDSFPVRCEMPIEGEDLSYVLYGSGGCSMYDAAKLEQLGAFGEIFEPAYVEDLDAGYRAWLRGWPTVFVAGAGVVHYHRATTSRFYTPEQLDRIVEVNYLRFLARAVASPALFASLWKEAVERLNRLSARMEPVRPALAALPAAASAPFWVETPPAGAADERALLALTSGEVAVFPGHAPRGKPVVLVASPYLPYPLSHGGAVRIYNLMRQAAAGYDQVLVCLAEQMTPVPDALKQICVEIVQVRRRGSHFRVSSRRPDTVEEFDSPAFHAALRQTARKWRPEIAQLEFTQMAQYAADCAPARTILVEHDITFDLYEQFLRRGEDWETRLQYERWLDFEQDAWKQVDAVAAMSDKDRRKVNSPRAVTLPNGVDLERFQPSSQAPEAGRILFIGSFAHLPNILAVDFFLREVWPLLRVKASPTLHIIAGSRHAYYLEMNKERVRPPLDRQGIEVEDFVADPRAAYHRAAIVIAPLLASAGTNIKIMEAMAMGKAIVSTPAGINGLDRLRPGHDVLVSETAEGLAEHILALLADPERSARIGVNARRGAELHYDWKVVGARQHGLYESLRQQSPRPR